MGLPYANASSGEKAMAEINKILRHFGCSKIGTMENFDAGELCVQFEYHGRLIELRASMRGYAAAWLRENEWNYRRKCTEQEHKRKAAEIGAVAVYSILRDWIKAQITAVDTGLLSFEGVFMPHFLLPDGSRVLDRADKILKLPASAAS
jgi:hypothetical protein